MRDTGRQRERKTERERYLGLFNTVIELRERKTEREREKERGVSA